MLAVPVYYLRNIGHGGSRCHSLRCKLLNESRKHQVGPRLVDVPHVGVLPLPEDGILRQGKRESGHCASRGRGHGLACEATRVTAAQCSPDWIKRIVSRFPLLALNGEQANDKPLCAPQHGLVVGAEREALEVVAKCCLFAACSLLKVGSSVMDCELLAILLQSSSYAMIVKKLSGWLAIALSR